MAQGFPRGSYFSRAAAALQGQTTAPWMLTVFVTYLDFLSPPTPILALV